MWIAKRPDGFFRQSVHCSRKMKSTCRGISATPESAHEPAFIILAGRCPATCQIGRPAPHIYLLGRPTVVSNDLNLICVFLFLYPTPDKTVKLWKISERDKRPEGYNLKDEDGRIRDPSTITSLRVMMKLPPSLTHVSWCMLVRLIFQKKSYI